MFLKIKCSKRKTVRLVKFHGKHVVGLLNVKMLTNTFANIYFFNNLELNSFF